MSNNTEDFWGVNPEQIQNESDQAENDRKKFGALTAGIYNAQIEKVYLSKSDGGATAFEVDATEILEDGGEGKKIFAKFWIKSGDAKGNKATYTDKSGNERLLPAWIQVGHLLKIAGLELEKLKPIDAEIERGDKIIQVKAIKEFTGLKLKIVIQQYEDDYSGEIQLRYEVKDFLNIDGTDHKGDEKAEESWRKTLEKNPVRKLKKKKEEPKQSAEEKEAIDKW